MTVADVIDELENVKVISGSFKGGQKYEGISCTVFI